MMAAGESVKVAVVTDRYPNLIPCSSDFTAEELCILLCKKYNIPPLTRTLFALRIKGTNYFLKDNSKVLSSSRDYELRIRFKVPRFGFLTTLDETTYDYYFQQARNDVNDNSIPEIKYPDHKHELLGLGIVDMCRAVLEEKISLRDIIRNYKKYLSIVIVKRHGHFTKKYAHDYLPKLCSMEHNINYIKNQYLQKMYTLAPNYLAEEYDNVLWKNGGDVIPVRVVIAPFHPHQPGIRFYNNIKREWFHVCTIEELIYLTRNGDNSLEVSRRGTPLFLKFKCEEQLSSFISVCDGYYRLMVKWTFNLSKDDESPSLKELQRLKCHGPVGGAFSYRKLEEKRSKKHGCYILRQCQDEYNIFYLDVCTKNSTTETYRLEFKGHYYTFNKEEYPSFEKLVSYHKNPEGRIYLNECIPPSEYDKSQLLLCGEPLKKGVRINQAELQEILKDNKSPRCLPNKDILLYTGSEKIGTEGIMATYKALWKLDETKKMLVAFKTLQREKANDHLKDFIEIASKWSCVTSSSIVRLYGVTLSSPTAMVLEYLQYGPFDHYLSGMNAAETARNIIAVFAEDMANNLVTYNKDKGEFRENGDKIKPIHLKKVAAGLARALWDLSEAGVVHGYIRCHRLLLAAHEADRIVVKLSGPSIRHYTPKDIHWMPVEFFNEMDLAKWSVVGDIWAFATTLWEVFSYGESPTETNPALTAKSYEMGGRLFRPARCPSEVWALMRQCWLSDPLRPQEIMRDMNHMLYREYIPVHEYEEPKISLDHRPCEADTVSSDRFIPSECDAGSSKSLISDNSVSSVNGMSDHYGDFFGDNKSSCSFENIKELTYMLKADMASMRSQNSTGGGGVGGGGGAHAEECGAAGAPRLMESIVSQGKTYLVTLTKKIGSGNYGHVYKGWMERDNQESQKKEVAVKKLTRQACENGTLYEDFRNELEIMKTLQHTNIVEILGYSWDHSSDVLIVMEYLEEGSLNYYLKFQGDKLRLSHLLKYCQDIATGMDHVSAKNVVHRDLATRNILVVNKYHVKISDFGLARIIPKDESAYLLKTERLLPFNWYAPESAVKPWHFSTKSDVWSFGVTAWEIFTRAKQEVPKFDLDRPRERASCFQIPEECPSEIYRHLMKNCWELDPNQRPKFIDLVLLCKMYIEEYK